MSTNPAPLWEPAAGARETSAMGLFMDWLAAERGVGCATYDELWRWSVDNVDGFWEAVWSFFGVRSATGYELVRRGDMPGPAWFPGATLNYAAHALARTGDDLAVIARSQDKAERRLTRDELRDAVSRCRTGLVRLGVGRGDVVAAYLPNGPEALVAFLAAASMGATWSSCPPEFGPRSVIDRFGQLAPSVLFVTRGYRYGAKDVDRRDQVAAIVDALPTLRSVVDVDTDWHELLSVAGPLELEQVPFDHPLYVLFSSGTTGPPKAIVHGHGGILLEHLKALGLHEDLGPGDRFFWYSTTGWMMWNYLVSGLLVGATIVLFDGDPSWPDLGVLWRMTAELGVTTFGTSAPFLLACRKAGLSLAGCGDLSEVRSIGSTGAPLPAEGFEWVYQQLPQVRLASMSGGTDVCTAFVGGSPLVPVVAGEISCRALGAHVEAFDETGRPLIGAEGELVLTQPMPSMPVGFWGDETGERFRDAYFSRYPGVWCHGDWLTVTERGSCVITGRSDATLNRGGVRFGTSELYTVVESLGSVRDSLVVHLDGPESGRLALFVVLEDTPADIAPGRADDALVREIADALRSSLSPRHVPDEVFVVPAIPRTHSGKKLEVPVKRLLDGADPGRVLSAGSLADPSAIDAFVELRSLLA